MILNRIKIVEGKVFIYEAAVVKETDKRYSLGSGGRAYVLKSELGRQLGYHGIFCFPEQTEDIIRQELKKRIGLTKTRIKSDTAELEELEKSLVNYQ